MCHMDPNLGSFPRASLRLRWATNAGRRGTLLTSTGAHRRAARQIVLAPRGAPALARGDAQTPKQLLGWVLVVLCHSGNVRCAGAFISWYFLPLARTESAFRVVLYSSDCLLAGRGACGTASIASYLVRYPLKHVDICISYLTTVD